MINPYLTTRAVETEVLQSKEEQKPNVPISFITSRIIRSEACTLQLPVTSEFKPQTNIYIINLVTFYIINAPSIWSCFILLFMLLHLTKSCWQDQLIEDPSDYLLNEYAEEIRKYIENWRENFSFKLKVVFCCQGS